jgi:hypothetical protein
VRALAGWFSTSAVDPALTPAIDSDHRSDTEMDELQQRAGHVDGLLHP